MSLIIAAPSSGVGKTTVTLAILSYLAQKNEAVQSFKVGPDYIDPMYHNRVCHRISRNLDPVLTSPAYVQSCFDLHCVGVNYALVEGVMGLFDGIKLHNQGDFGSTAHIARLLDIPVLLVVDCSRLSGSIAAIAHGFSTFDQRVKIAGLVLNKVGSDRHLQILQDSLEPLNIPILGVLRRQQQISLSDRHLGLVPPEEINQVNNIFNGLAEIGRTCFNWEKLAPLLRVTPQKQVNKPESKKPSVRIAIAQDQAFNFYYQDNLDILQQQGVELIPWSPLKDKLPENIQGLYFGGGFPEVFAQELANNTRGKNAIKTAINQGMPTLAECGGLMYLCENIIDFEEKTWEMVGVLPTEAIMTKNLTLGYRQAKAIENSIILEQGETVWGHEFHRSQLTQESRKPLLETKGYQTHSPTVYQGWGLKRVQASYVHLHFGVNKQLVERFIKQCGGN